MVNKSKKLIGTLLVSCIVLMMSVTAMATVKECMQGVRINSAVGAYSEEFTVNILNVPTPYLQYKTVTTNGNYGVTSQYRNNSSYHNVSIKTFYASSIASGRVLTEVTFHRHSLNRVLVYRSSGSLVDFTIDFLRVDI